MVNLCGVSFNNIAIFTLNLKLKLKMLMLLLGFCKCRDFKKWTSLSPIMSLLLFLFFFQITPMHSQTHQDIISIDRHYIQMHMKIQWCISIVSLTFYIINWQSNQMHFWGAKPKAFSTCKPFLILIHGFGPTCAWQWHLQ